jgi:hypothetical protein
MCGVESGFGDWCGQVAYVSDRARLGGIIPRPVLVPELVPGKGFVPPDQGFQPAAQAFGVVRDSFWPKSAVAWVVISVVLTVASVQLVTPTRRWRVRRPGFLAAIRRRRT